MPKKIKPADKEHSFPVVGIGASAGGLDAFTRFLQAIPLKSGMAYVIVQHLNPAHKSILPELLSKATKIPVYLIKNDIEILPDRIYIIPENKMLTASDGVLKLFPRDLSNKRNLPIDLFFKSLAEVHETLAVGVVLSGTASDGTKGLRDIKEKGGITFAQDVRSAAFEGMPQSAINAEVVDFVLPPEKIPEKILQINKIYESDFDSDGKSALSQEDERSLKQILAIIRQRSNVDFTYYKQPTLRRRLARRLSFKRVKTFSDYLELLRNDKEEQDALFSDILIPVTAFFRDPKTFENLANSVYPELLKKRSGNDAIRVWVAGCSTGQEAYSLAISLHEFFSDKAQAVKIQIFATDISENNILKARSASYTRQEMEGISAARLQKYFTKTDGSYHLNKTIRNMCIFAVHNFLKDPPFSRIDLVSCRNVLIYMEPYLQKKAFSTFYYALKDNGYLLLGRSETTTSSSDLFSILYNNDKIYTRKPGILRNRQEHEKTEDYISEKNTVRKQPVSATDFQKSADEILLSKYTPPAVIINEQYDIVLFRGDTSLFLSPSSGKASLNVLKMAKQGLSFELRNALHKAPEKKTAVSKENLPLQGVSDYLVSVEIVPLTNAIDLHFLILFRKIPIPAMEQEYDQKSSEKIKSDRARQRIDQLEKELALTREDIRSITEDQEAYNEELQSANEELLSSGEELQTINEELETSKEELQSGNEELLMVNQELIDRQDSLSTVRQKLEAVNKQLSIQNVIFRQAEESSGQGSYSLNLATGKLAYSDNFCRIIGCEPGEIASLEEFIQFVHPEDREYVRSVSEEVAREKKGAEWKYRIIKKNGEKLYIKSTAIVIFSEDEMILVGTLQDITLDTEINRKLTVREEQLSESHRMGKTGSWEVDFVNKTITWSDEMYGIYGYRPGEIKVDMKTFGKVHPDDADAFMQALEQSGKHGIPFELEYRQYDKSGMLHHIYSRGNVKKNKSGKPVSLFCTSIDLSELRQKEVLLHENNTELENKNLELERKNIELSSFSYVASHDLQEPLRKIQTFSKRLQDKFTDIPEEMKSYLDKMEAASARMGALIKDLLEYSRLANPEKLFEKTDLNICIGTILTDFELLIEQKKAKIKVGKLPVIDAIPVQMNQLFYNLISNALKFSAEKRAPLIYISYRKISSEDIKNNLSLDPQLTYVEIIVKDNGIGFDPAYSKQIFVIFKRLHEKSRYHGTGIGLSVARKIIDIHHGMIYAESKENAGSEFHVILPINQLPEK